MPLSRIALANCAHRTATAAGALLRTAAAAARAVLGAPDYERYLAHMRQHHPTDPPLTRAAHFTAQLERRHNRPGARCC